MNKLVKNIVEGFDFSKSNNNKGLNTTGMFNAVIEEAVKEIKENKYPTFDLFKLNKAIYKPKDKQELQEICFKCMTLFIDSDEVCNLNWLDVSEIIDMSSLFYTYVEYPCTIDVSKWDVSNVVYMESMFRYCEKINIGDISNWNVSKVREMGHMFDDCKLFNGDLSKWDVSSVRDMGQMFRHCKQMKDPGISNWDVSNVLSMDGMFFECPLFNADLSKWDVSNVRDMDQMFGGCESFNSDLSNWNTSNLRLVSHMFKGCKSLNTNLDNWDISKLEIKFTRFMFDGCESMKKLPKWLII